MIVSMANSRQLTRVILHAINAQVEIIPLKKWFQID